MRSKPPRLAKPAVVLALALALCGPASADPRIMSAPGVGVEAGLFCPPHASDRRPAPDTVFGWVHIPDEPIRILIPGEMTVPAVLGLGFGVSFTVERAMDLTYVITHPPMAPSGTTVQGWTGRAEPGRAEGVYFQFDIPEELLPGAWEITALWGDEPLFSANFTVTRPEDAPQHTQLCRQPLLLTSLSPQSRGE